MIFRLHLCCDYVSVSNDDVLKNSWTIFPNPNRGYFTVHFTEPIQPDVSITITDLMGKEVSYSINKEANNLRIQLQEISSGMYILEVKNGKSKQFVKWVIY